MERKKVIISGGGTGGHIFPAIAIADAIKQISPDSEILFVGAKGRMEMEKVPAAGYPIKGLDVVGFKRKFTFENFKLPFKLLRSMVQARSIVKDFDPDVAVGVGGYASGPILRMCSALGIPTVIQEQNSYAGITNKILSRRAKAVCVAYDKMDKFFTKDKILVTGNPVRRDITDSLEGRLEEAFQYYKLKKGNKTILVFGGSLGARSLNNAIRDAEAIIAARPDVNLLWQTGKLYAEEFSKSATAKLPNVSQVTFLDRMDLAYAMADLVVCRAGALTISELCVTGKPSILVPSPNVAEDHQTHNAYAMTTKNAADMVPESEVAEKLAERMFSLIDNTERLEQLHTNALLLAKPDAATEIANVVLSNAR